VARALSRESVYTEALRRKRGTPAEGGEAAVMRTMTVRDVMRSDQVTIPADLPLPQILDRFIEARRNHVYVVDPEGRFEGVIGWHDVNRALRELGDPPRIAARDLANTRFAVVTPTEHLDRVLEKFWAEEAERLPVVENRSSRKLVGTVSQRDILGVYSLEVLHQRSLVARFQSDVATEPGPTYVELPADHQVEDLPVPPGVAGLTVAEARFRERYGVSVLLVRRAGARENRLVAEGGTRLEADDRLVVLGSREKIEALRRSIRDEPKPAS